MVAIDSKYEGLRKAHKESADSLALKEKALEEAREKLLNAERDREEALSAYERVIEEAKGEVDIGMITEAYRACMENYMRSLYEILIKDEISDEEEERVQQIIKKMRVLRKSFGTKTGHEETAQEQSETEEERTLYNGVEDLFGKHRVPVKDRWWYYKHAAYLRSKGARVGPILNTLEEKMTSPPPPPSVKVLDWTRGTKPIK